MKIEKRMKVPNGKLLIIKADVEGGTIRKAAIQGDFFFHPEEKLPLFEAAIAGASDALLLQQHLQDIIDKNGIRLCGITTEAVALLVGQIIAEAEK